jgi:RNA polymerase sigma-70 factor, ECF subfamily
MAASHCRPARRRRSATRTCAWQDQDRARWDRAEIEEGLALVEATLRPGPPDAYALQAAIAVLHARATSAADTDWARSQASTPRSTP